MPLTQVKTGLKLTLLALGLMGWLPALAATPALPVLQVSARTGWMGCREAMAQAEAMLKESQLPLKQPVVGAASPDCKKVRVTVAGLVSQEDLRALLARLGLTGTGQADAITIIPPPHLTVRAEPAPQPLQVQWPPHLSGRSGQTLRVNLPLLNSSGAGEITWGSDSYDYEVLDSHGQVMQYRGKWYFTAEERLMQCPAARECTLALPLEVALVRVNPQLPLPPGEYTLRVRLSNFRFQGQTLDFGTHDIPLTILP